ncbi:aminodeoxychorismate lyase [Acinetobacter sp. CAAS 2-6]|uniref:aminodeoxychorismate lyase n=1 Tax=Acinetobacter sp. CAAS 2-6 TaxID=3016358 RepID=UPI002DD65E6D|nr:aminodeoxychorismate lyase [Acinetobacter sp. CAAS 2-6]
MQVFQNAQEIHAVSVLDRAFHYGDGCFTTARIRANQIELRTRHWSRLQQACQQLLLQADLSLIEQSLALLQQQHTALNGTLKIMISRGEGQRGYAFPDHPADVYVFYYPHAVAHFQPESLRSGILQQRIGLTMPALLGVKTLNRLEQVMLKHEAQQQGWPEALVFDVQDRLVEGVSSNCFVWQNNRWITPELRYNGIHGVMRAEILARMQARGIACEQRSVTLDELSQTQSLFFCNALGPMKMVTQLNDRSLHLQPCLELFQILQLDQID